MNMRIKLKHLLKNKIAVTVVFLLTAVLLEIFVFNYKYWATLFTKVVKSPVITFGDGYELIDNGKIKTVPGDYSIIISDIGVKLKSLHVDFDFEEPTVYEYESEQPRTMDLSFALKDESNKDWSGMGRRTYYASEERSHYYMVHSYGRADSIRINPNMPEGCVLNSITVSVNSRVPLLFSFERVLAIVLILLFIYVFRPSSSIYRKVLTSLNYKLLYLILILFFMVNALGFGMISYMNPYFQCERGENQEQYQSLTRAFSEKSLALLDKPADFLINMENPYDRAERDRMANENGSWYKWDHAYYDGNYYVYFGVAPVALFYYPYYMLTGEMIKNRDMILAMSLVFMAALIMISYGFVSKRFRKMSVGAYILSTELLIVSTNIIYILKRPDFYSVPIISGLAFGFMGMYMYMKAFEGDVTRYKYLVTASFLTAIVAGCRPQLFLIMALPAALYIGKLFRRNEDEKGVDIKAVLAIILPMVIIAAPLMLYNYMRFGSAFDFGANYNLNFNDMRNRGWEIDRAFLGLAAFIFQPLHLKTEFPFTEPIYFNPSYLGFTLQEATLGGVLFTTPFVWLIAPVLIKHRKFSEHQSCIRMIATGVISTVVIIVVDANMAGIVNRYFSDFSVFLALSAFLAACLILTSDKIEVRTKRFFTIFLVVCFLWNIAYNTMTFYLDTGEEMRNLRRDLYSHLMSLVAFWY